MHNDVQPTCLRVAQVAKRLQVCDETVRRMVGRKELIGLRVGRAVRITLASVEAWEQGNWHGPATNEQTTSSAKSAPSGMSSGGTLTLVRTDRGARAKVIANALKRS